MLDLKLLREQPDAIREALQKRGTRFELDALLSWESKRRTMLKEIEEARHTLRTQSDAFGRQRAAGATTPPPALKTLSDEIAHREGNLKLLEEEVLRQLSYLPNIPHSSVPVGDSTKNQVVRVHGAKPSPEFKPKTYLELGESLGLFDFARAAKISGTHFPLYTGWGARLERALMTWMLDVQTKEHGYTEIFPPFLVNRASMFGSG